MMNGPRLSVGVALCALALSAATPVPVSGERRLAFNDGWRFFKGEAAGAERPDFADAAWRTVQLPHDWAIEGPFDSKLNPHTGALPIFGTGWYRKSFTLPAGAANRFYSIEFDGAMSNARVSLNGHELGGRPYGYIGFSFDLTPYLRFDGDNVIAVRLTPEDHSSRWYPGAGIYRNVWLDVTGPQHVARWGTYVTTPEVSGEKATIAVKTELRNRAGSAATVALRTSVLDADGKSVAQTSSQATLAAGGSSTESASLSLAHPQRWDIDRPYLYTLVSEVLDGQRVVEVVGLRQHGRVVEGWAAGDHGARGDPLRQLERRGQCVLPTLGPTHHAERSDLEVVQQRDDVGAHPGQQSVTGESVGRVDPGPVGGDHAQTQVPGDLVGGTDIVTAHQPAVATQDGRARRVAVHGVAESAAAGEAQGVVTSHQAHGRRPQRMVGDAGEGADPCLWAGPRIPRS